MAYISNAALLCDDCGHDARYNLKYSERTPVDCRRCNWRGTLADVDPDGNGGTCGADSWYDCPECGDIEAGTVAVDAYAYDSDEAPKWVDAEHEPNATDCPSHCDGCGDYIPEPLTDEGARYVAAAAARYIRTGEGDRDALGEWVETARESGMAEGMAAVWLEAFYWGSTPATPTCYGGRWPERWARRAAD